MHLDLSNHRTMDVVRKLAARQMTPQGALTALRCRPDELREFLGDQRTRDALRKPLGAPQNGSEGIPVPKAGSGAQKAVTKQGGRLRLDDTETFQTLALRALGLSTNLIVMDELECTEANLIRFMKRSKVMAKLQREVQELKQSGEVARRMANAGLSHGVEAMSNIIRDEDTGASAKIGATTTLSKVASVNGKQPKANEDSGNTFRIEINLAGCEPVSIEAPVEGEVVNEQ